MNISTSGVLVETGSMISIGSLLRYSVSFPGFDRSFDIKGEVVRGERKERQMCDELLAMDAIAKCGADRTYNTSEELEEAPDAPARRFQNLRRDATMTPGAGCADPQRQNKEESI